ncbi:DUF2235 domain-containing protein [Mycena venus]|uniref:DUF2235 domain-containing protein n=1 Tax=Mycena venus TaxID=2733690 RepID=A0A8H6WR55_9AGAR|nr:DUF2235 domain-containing protein [Mycena venus]
MQPALTSAGRGDDTSVDHNRISALPSSTQGSSFTVIPPDHPFRTLVLCFDGIRDSFPAHNSNSNIVQLFSMLLKSDPTRQMVYYYGGIGTYTTPHPFMSKVSRLIDEAIAWNLDADVMGGYKFLMQNYNANDRICIFGFSRGAHIARSLVGMIHKVGLLPVDHHQQVPYAYRIYKRTDAEGWSQSNAFKRAFSNDVDIEFVGVWDTVNSVGLIPRRLPFTISNTVVRTFRHAVSLDERRAKFKPSLFNHPSKKDKKPDPRAWQARPHPSKKLSQHLKERKSERKSERDHRPPTDVDEVLCCGFSPVASLILLTDVGGGSVAYDTRHSMARISLRWMIRECFKTKSGIMFDCDGLRVIGLDPASLFPHVTPRPPALPAGPLRIRSISSFEAAHREAALRNPDQPASPSEEEEEMQDAQCPIYDQLSRAWLWWPFEVLPFKQRYQRDDDSWGTHFRWNLGKGRVIPKQKANGVRVHRSVKTRLEAMAESGGQYKPKAAFDLGRAIWVD